MKNSDSENSAVSFKEYLPLISEINKNSIEMYKFISVLMMSLNGAAALALVKEGVQTYALPICIFIFGLLISASLSTLAYIYSYNTLCFFKEENSKDKTTIHCHLLNTYIKRILIAHRFNMFSFVASLGSFEAGLFVVLGRHMYS